jgi:cytochrome P450
VVFAFGPDYNQVLLSKPDVFYSNRFTLPGPKNSAQRRLGLGLITVNGEQHKCHRRLVLPAFQKKAGEHHLAVLVAATERLLENWGPGQLRDMAGEMAQLAWHVTSQALFGVDDVEAACRLGRLTDDFLERNTSLGLSGLLPVNGSGAAYQDLLACADRPNDRPSSGGRREGPPWGPLAVCPLSHQFFRVRFCRRGPSTMVENLVRESDHGSAHDEREA